MQYSVGGIINLKVFCLHEVGHLVWVNQLLATNRNVYGSYIVESKQIPYFPR